MILPYVVPCFMIVMGAGIAVIWTRDILAGKEVDTSAGILKARETRSNELMWPHWAAEYLTSLLLILGGAALLVSVRPDPSLAAVALGMLLYSSLNSLSWAFAAKERYVYAAPMLLGLLGALVGTVSMLL